MYKIIKSLPTTKLSFLHSFTLLLLWVLWIEDFIHCGHCVNLIGKEAAIPTDVWATTIVFHCCNFLVYFFNITNDSYSCLHYKHTKTQTVSCCTSQQGIYTGCHRRNGPNFGRVFLMLNYTDITQNTYIKSWTVTETMAREVWNFDSCYTLTDYQIHIETGRNMWFL